MAAARRHVAAWGTQAVSAPLCPSTPPPASHTSPALEERATPLIDKSYPCKRGHVGGTARLLVGVEQLVRELVHGAAVRVDPILHRRQTDVGTRRAQKRRDGAGTATSTTFSTTTGRERTVVKENARREIMT
jgi:hypothetical protein